MEKRSSSRSGLFLLELIISILFFSIASSVCIQLFVKAHLMDKDNENLNQAIHVCVNFSEVYTAYAGNEAAMTDLYPNALLTFDDASAPISMQLFFASDWNECPSASASFVLTVHFTQETESAGIMHYASAAVTDQENAVIYQLDTNVYQSNRGGDSQ